MLKLIAGLVIFFGVHSVSIVARDWRERTVARIGPAVIEEVTTTIVIEPDWTAELHETGVYLLDYTG